MVNQSKINDPRFWKKWRQSGAVSPTQEEIEKKYLSKAIILEGTLNNVQGELVFDEEGYYRGFINTNATRFGGVIPGPKGIVAAVLLPNGIIQNPDGTPSNYSNSAAYLMAKVKPIKEPIYDVSSFLKAS